MKYLLHSTMRLFYIFPVSLFLCCNGNNPAPSKELISQINLKRGAIISCSPGELQLGSAAFEMSCNEKAKKDFNLAIGLLHSFEYDESEKAFAKVIDESPECAMAYWGVAMSNFHSLWAPPSADELQKGSKAIELANTITKKTKRESAYINAIATFYKDWNKTDHLTRCINYEKAMEKVYNDFQQDKEASIFYALSLVASANPADKSYTNQKKAGTILNAIYPSEPNHPGIIHYIIHTYDYPGLAELALPAAREYAAVAPSSAHALHMPSHIFTRLGLWDECIKSNLESVASAKCYAEQTGIKGHWDEELHGMDYLVYAYLQKADNKAAKAQLEYLETFNYVYPVNFKVAYAFAAIPARFFLENKNWHEAAAVKLYPVDFPWIKFPWQESIIHFSRLLGAVHLGNIKAANSELVKLNQLYDTLKKQNNVYNAGQVDIQIKTGQAWIQFVKGKTAEALNLMKIAVDMEDATGKHPVTPGEVLPAGELLGDMFLQAKQFDKALLAYETVLQKSPNRFNSIYGAGSAAERSGNKEKAAIYYRQLLAITSAENVDRPELVSARSFLSER